MIQVALVGIGAALAAALLFLSPIGGTALAFPLFALCGLPVAIAGLAWGSLSGAIAAVTAAAVIFAFLSYPAAVVHFCLFGAPLAWVAHLAGLSRPVDGSPAGTVEWYPLGRLLGQVALAASIGLVLVGVLIGFDPDALTREMTEALVEWMASAPGAAPPPTAAELEPFARFNVAALPYSVSALLVVILVFNLWLASRIAGTSGRLARPRERLWTAVLPNEVIVVFFVALLAALAAPGAISYSAGVATGAAGAAIALAGLAVLHALTLGTSIRTLILVTTYVILILFGFPIVLLFLLGLAESAFQLRARRFRGAPPPLT